jgi:hypothetical protein
MEEEDWAVQVTMVGGRLVLESVADDLFHPDQVESSEESSPKNAVLCHIVGV